jgi:hypothetical protein
VCCFVLFLFYILFFSFLCLRWTAHSFKSSQRFFLFLLLLAVHFIWRDAAGILWRVNGRGTGARFGSVGFFVFFLEQTAGCRNRIYSPAGEYHFTHPVEEERAAQLFFFFFLSFIIFFFFFLLRAGPATTLYARCPPFFSPFLAILRAPRRVTPLYSFPFSFVSVCV